MEEVVSVKDAVHRLQLCLLGGIQDEDKLFVAGSIMSQSDYHDVVTERSIANMCGYPLCRNVLPSDRPRKGRYRISLKEHKVYDLQETYMYCSTSCVVNSLAFAGSMQEERSAAVNPSKLNEILRLVNGLSLEDSEDDQRKDNKLGLSEVRVQEKAHVTGGEVSLEEWIGPSNAIEGYVPQRDRSKKPAQREKLKKGPEPKQTHGYFSEMDFTSEIITQDEYNISKDPCLTRAASDKNAENSEWEASDQTADRGSDVLMDRRLSYEVLNDLSDKMNNNLNILDSASARGHGNLNKYDMEPDSAMPAEKTSTSIVSGVKSSLKMSNVKNVTRSVTWADEKSDSNSNQTLCTFKELVDNRENTFGGSDSDMEVDDNSYRFASAEACALALAQAANAVMSGGSDVLDAVAEAGIQILTPDGVVESGTLEEDGLYHAEPVYPKWPRKSSLPNSDLFDSDDSWYDSPPEDFSLTLSPFATMFMALFAWISSSSLAYIYGHDEELSEEYSCINGREYPTKAVLPDGRSSEIRQALAVCLARSLPGLIAELRLPMPISTLEKEVTHLLNTMSFMDPLPPFRMRQLQLIVFLFLEAISVCRIPALGHYMTGRRIWLPKILEGAQISSEEYEIMKDLLIPLGRVPQLATQSGG